MPDLDLADGRRVSDLLHAGRGVLLERGPVARHGPGGAVDHAVAGTEIGADAVLIRPDGYVCWAAGAGDLVEALARWFTPRPGPPPP
ncbi:MAG TPA: hypothetical protein VOB72_10680 [Candidatus Dormibacteraeota bacterium]|nr:hypothetical protein [Candidatus Dormibacteraeota bacterium]